MSMTITEKILANHAGLAEVVPGQLITAKLDLVLANDVTAPVAIKEFEKFGSDRVFDTRKVALILDHFAPNKDIASAEQCKFIKEFARKQNVEHFYQAGRMGIEHCLLPELGLTLPGIVLSGRIHILVLTGLGGFCHRCGQY